MIEYHGLKVDLTPLVALLSAATTFWTAYKGLKGKRKRGDSKDG